MSINTTAFEASLQTKMDNVTDSKEMLLLGKAYESAVGGISLSSVTQEGSTQVANVTAEGTTQLANITTEGTTQVASVTAEGVAQVAAINAVGGYSHPTPENGGMHVPYDGGTNAGKLLTATATAGSPTWQDAPVSLPAQSASTATKYLQSDGTGASWVTVSTDNTVFGGWTVTEVGTDLVFSTGGAAKMKVDASGNLTCVGNVTAFGTL